MTSTERSLSLAQRHRKRRSEEIRAEIIEAAIAEFALKGFHDTSLADIAKRLGTGPSTIYNYFGSKRDVLVEVVNTTTLTMLTTLTTVAGESEITDAQAFREAATRLGNALSDVAVQKPDMFRLMATAMTYPDPSIRELWLAPLRTAVALVENFLADGVLAGALRRDLDVSAIATSIVAIPFGILLTQPEADPDAVFGHSMVRAVVAMIEGGIASPAGSGA